MHDDFRLCMVCNVLGDRSASEDEDLGDAISLETSSGDLNPSHAGSSRHDDLHVVNNGQSDDEPDHEECRFKLQLPATTRYLTAVRCNPRITISGQLRKPKTLCTGVYMHSISVYRNSCSCRELAVHDDERRLKHMFTALVKVCSRAT